jgi:chlorite dismutase
MNVEGSEPFDISEKGRTVEGQRISSDRRLFMQLLAYGGCEDVKSLAANLAELDWQGALYEDMNDPQGLALLAISEDPGHLLNQVRESLNQEPFKDLIFKPEYTMLGRTYALGHEPDLDHVLIHRPRGRALDPGLPWAIWYPLRRSGSFEQLSVDEQRVILMEHGGVGRAFGRSGYGYDIRLACHGLDKNDNDFVIGLVGAELHPLSSIVQRMRKTKQTSLYLEQLGPFFVGKVVWQSKVK